jgi:hypothetical protein
MGSLFGSSSSSQPVQQSSPVAFAPQFSDEQKPYLTEIFKQAQTQYEAEKERGHTSFPGPQLAGFTPEEQQSFEMYRQIAGGPGAQPFYTGATLASLGAAQDILAPEIFARMSPYQQAVTDVAQREAIRQFKTGPLQQIRTGAVAEGGLRGSRRAIAEEEGLRNLEQRLADMQTLGSQQAYTQALGEAASQRGRLAGLASILPNLGTGMTAAQQQQAALMGGIGETQRGMQQQAIDLARQEFAREEMYPVEALSRYLGYISGAPQPGGSVGQTGTVQGPSRLAQIGGLATGLGTLAGGLFGSSGIKFETGGRVGGLSSIVRRQAGGKVVRMQEGEVVPAPDESRSVSKIPARQDLQNIQFPQSGVIDYLRRNVGPAISGTLSDIYDVAGEGVEYLTGIQTPSATEALTNLGLSPEQAAAMSGEGRGVLSATLGLVGGDTKGLVGEAPKRVTASQKVEQPVAEPTAVEQPAAPPEIQAPAATSSPETKKNYFDRSTEERLAAYLKLRTPETEERPMSWGERLQLAGALMAAGSTPGTGSFLGDLAAFGSAAGLSAGKVLTEKEKRDRETALRKGQLYNDFLSYESGLRGEKRAERALDIQEAAVQQKRDAAKQKLLEMKDPSDPKVAEAIALLDRQSLNVRPTAKGKTGQYDTTGTAFALAKIVETIPELSMTEALDLAKRSGAYSDRDEEGYVSIDPALAIRSYLKGTSPKRETTTATRGPSGTLVVGKAEGGRITLRYPEDF